MTPGANQGSGLPGMRSNGSQEAGYREAGCGQPPVLALKLGLEELPAGSATVHNTLSSLL